MWGLPAATGRDRQTIAVLVDWLKDGYQSLVFDGMADAARDLDVNLVCLAGGVLRSPLRFGSQRNLVYNFAASKSVQGILLMSGTLGNHVGPTELGRFCERFAPRPIISLAVPLPGIPTVVVDDAEGMRGAMRHLTQVHGCKRIAFIRGPVVNEEAERRDSGSTRAFIRLRHRSSHDVMTTASPLRVPPPCRPGSPPGRRAGVRRAAPVRGGRLAGAGSA